MISIIRQRDVSLEIIICDDGSNENYYQETVELFKQHHFTDYIFITHEKNQGTVKNLIDGVKIAKGDYLKLISPGDFLYDEYTLRAFCDYASEHPAVAYFGLAPYYRLDDESSFVMIEKGNPRDLTPWIKRNKIEIRYNYIRNCDYAVGASFFVKTDVFLKHMLQIEGKIKYAEDYSFVIMVAEGENVEFVNRPIVFYEYGTGVSTNPQSEFRQCVRNDNVVGLQMIWPLLTKAEKIAKKSNRNIIENLLLYVLTPELILYRFGLRRKIVKQRIFYNAKDSLKLQELLHL